MLVVRRDYDGLRRYVHLGTGNYHPVTARIYSDVGLLSTDPTIAGDVGELFNYLTTGYGAGRRYDPIQNERSRMPKSPAPCIVRRRLVYGSTSACATRVVCDRVWPVYRKRCE